jgi:hypothetical protein
MKYREQLKDPRWQKKRLKILERDGWKCTECGNDKMELQIHHLKYHGSPWEVDDAYLKTLCANCHSKESNQPKKYNKEVTVDTNPEPHEQNVNLVWQAYTKKLDKIKSPAAHSFRLAKVLLIDERRFDIVTNNNLEQKFIEQERQLFSDYFKQIFGDAEIQFSVIIGKKVSLLDKLRKEILLRESKPIKSI